MLAKVLEKKKADDVVVIETKDRTVIADYFVICSATSDTHAKALIEAVEERLEKSGLSPLAVEGIGTLKWSLIDCGDVIVHIFSPEARKYYDLEGIWCD
ncbi:ribosome silencing factor [bacterium]|nr:ribosome silencing factor [bacterium]